MVKSLLFVTSAIGALALSAPALHAADANAAAAGSGTTIGELVVTAQRREENLQDTPVAVSAFSAASLSAKRLDGGQNLLLQIPNTNYSRSNFGGYNLKIRGIGSDVVGSGLSGTAGVSINENELPVTAAHFQDTDFFDVDRVEVVRGPQGTLYGRNATGGAVDIITTKPSSTFGGFGSIQYGNFNAVRATGAVNIPLGDAFALRVAGFRYFQDGFGENTYLNRRVDGRDLGAIRGTLSFKLNDKFNAYLLFEHFSEDDNRNRVGKQLCYKDNGPASVGGVAVTAGYAAFLSQGCQPGSLYGDGAYGTVNSNATLGGFLANVSGLSNGTDLFGNHPMQDHNLHNIESAIQPLYRAQQDLVDLHMAYNITDNLTLTSITGFNRETNATAEDYNRLVPVTPFQPVGTSDFGPIPLLLFPNGVVHDPQTGTSNKLTSFDYSSGQSKEYTEELRLASSFTGKFNFLVGGFYSELTAPRNSGTNYYVESNSLTGYSLVQNFAGLPAITIDPNYPPTGEGHNYYDSRTGGGFLKSYAGFGEVYYQFTPQVKLTLGGRYTTDQLYNLQYPISLLAPGGGFPDQVCPTSSPNVIKTCLNPQRLTQRAFTGRANLEWTPTLSFTDKTLIYATYARGYKGGGFNTACQPAFGATDCGFSPTFAPEYIDSYELGLKNTLLGGALTLNLDGFYYDYSGYQISRIISESSVNENINAKIYGVEFESVYSPIRNLTFNATVGFLHSAIGSGQSSVDSLNLSQGNPAYTLVKDTRPGNLAYNCLAPTVNVAGYIAGSYPAIGLSTQCGLGVTAGQVQYGIPQDLSGNRLPNTPEFTVSAGAQYVFQLPDDWKATLRGDYYWQDDSYARIYNAENDKLHSYHVVNATLTFSNVGEGVDLQLFVKNAFNAQPITATYVTDPTSGLFTNVFTLDPRTYGAQLTKRF